ncbi:MAG TPA: monovalent cation:proton antiporter-2 (CPA2) family protein [Burkholderiales bacterium]|jgi:glutathione-regulated potassium-efflux system ancillary protein KefC/glutathione-regulated potassium-efflux system protein KefB
MSLLAESAIFLAAAVVAVPLFRRLKLGAVLGYLAAGVIIGPWGLRLVAEVDNILHFAELGVVLLLFIIGLELQPSRLWVLRKSVFGLGGAQVLATGVVLGVAGLALGLPWPSALVMGLALAMSSTAFVLQVLAERNQLTTRHGRSTFAILLFQDLSVIPLLALVPLLGTAGAHRGDPWLSAALALAVIAAVVAGGRLLLRPVLHLIAQSRIQEIFTAAALLVVIGVSLLMSGVGLSMSLGAFLAGVLLADSEYRHELEANIQPFKGLLLGLFFISVGMSVDLGLIASRPALIVGAFLGLMALKAAVLWALARAAGHGEESARNLAIALCQGGEFAFVLFNLAAGHAVMERALVDLLIVVVSLSMAATPLALAGNDLLSRRLARARPQRPFDTFEQEAPRVIIAGFGRVGQIVGRILKLKRIAFTALDISPEQVQTVRRFGNKVHYGDASRLDLLTAAGASGAKLFVLAIDDVEASIRTARTVRRHFPDLTVYARARNRFHAHRLMDLGVELIERETFLGSLDLARQVLEAVGMAGWEAQQIVARFQAHDEQTLRRQHAVYHDETQLIQSARQAAEELQGLFESDQEDASRVLGAPAFSPSDVR